MPAFEANSLIAVPRSSVATEYLPPLPPQSCVSKAAQLLRSAYWSMKGGEQT